MESADMSREKLLIPENVLALLPPDPFEQLDLSRRISLLAFSSHVSRLEDESSRLKATAGDKDKQLKVLEQRVVELEEALQVTKDKLAVSQFELVKVAGERDTLAATVKRLTKDVAKLETFRRTLMQSLQDEDGHDPSMATSEGRTPTVTSSVLLHSRNMPYVDAQVEDGDGSLQQAPAIARLLPAGAGSAGGISGSFPAEKLSNPDVDVPMRVSSEDDNQGSASTVTPSVKVYMTSQATTTAARRRTSSVTGFGTADVSTAMNEDESAAAEADARSVPHPINIPPRGGTPSLTPHLTPSVTPTGSPRRSASNDAARTPRVDGKEFFRQARSRLSYEQFSSFLANIKELNAHRASREETLRKAEDIFGAENRDLYSAFEALLTRHLPS